MSRSGGVVRKKRIQEPVPYVMKVHKRTGTLYLERERPGFYRELPYVAVMVIALVFALLSCCQYIQLNTEIGYRDRRMNDLQEQILLIQNENARREAAALQGITLGEIYRIATEELGMVPATRENILFFEQTDREFIYQTERIPDRGS